MSTPLVAQEATPTQFIWLHVVLSEGADNRCVVSTSSHTTQPYDGWIHRTRYQANMQRRRPVDRYQANVQIILFHAVCYNVQTTIKELYFLGGERNSVILISGMPTDTCIYNIRAS